MGRFAITLVLAWCCAAAESPYYAPIRNNDLTALNNLVRASGVKMRDGRGNSALMYAAALGSVESMRLLLEAGADANAVNDFGATPLMWCAWDAAKVRLLLAKGAMLDRLLHHWHVLKCGPKSWRTKIAVAD